jgi:hypothetical protein
MPTNTFAAVESPTTPPTRIDHRRQHPPVEEQRGKRAHHQHQRQRAEGENERRGRVRDFEGRRAAAEVAEHEARPGLRRALEDQQGVVELQKCLL